MSSIAAKRKLLVTDVMTAHPRTLPPHASVREAASLMKESNIGDVLVVDGESLTGILTDRDIVVRTVAIGRDPEQVTVAEAMTANPDWIRPELHALEALDRMRKDGVHRLPVLDNGRVVGIVSLGDLMLKLDERSAAADIFEQQQSGN